MQFAALIASYDDKTTFYRVLRGALKAGCLPQSGIRNQQRPAPVYPEAGR